MARHRGRGIASINYPIGMNLGGDPSQALVHSNPSGKFTVSLSSIDLGQGMKSVTRQICAETLGVPVEDVYVDTADSDTGPHCMGSFASRGTHRVGNAVMVAAKEARRVMMDQGMSQGRIRAVRGFADNDLRVPNTPLDPRNRRVSIVVRSTAAKELEATVRSVVPGK
jgi:CO/xanthine dehydrogenase Mo-binding subunit